MIDENEGDVCEDEMIKSDTSDLLSILKAFDRMME